MTRVTSRQVTGNYRTDKGPESALSRSWAGPETLTGTDFSSVIAQQVYDDEAGPRLSQNVRSVREGQG